MQKTFYEILQVNPAASIEIIKAAYTHLRPGVLLAADKGSEDAKNQLVFIDEAYATLLSPEKRAAYDLKLSINAAASSYSQSDNNIAADRGTHSRQESSGRQFLLAGVFFAAVFATYKFIGQQGEQKTQSQQVQTQTQKETGSLKNDAYRAETERSLALGTVKNQSNLIDKSYDIAAREAERRRTELEYKANAGGQQLEMMRQRQEAMLQDQRWRQEQYEKDRQAREAKAAAEAPKRQLCNMYALNGNTRDARAAGCYRY